MQLTKSRHTPESVIRSLRPPPNNRLTSPPHTVATRCVTRRQIRLPQPGLFEIEVIAGGQLSPIEPTSDVADHLSRGGDIHLCLRVDDLDQIVAGLKDQGVEFVAEPFEVAPIGQLLAMIKDNSGNIIELAQAVA